MISVLKETATSRLKINDIQTLKAMGEEPIELG